MTLVDTSVWLDHLNTAVPSLARLLLKDEIMMHRYVIGEVAMGNWRRRSQTLADLNEMRQVMPATHSEVLQLVERHHLYGTGIGYVDVHLLAAVRMTPGCDFWTRDKRLKTAATKLGIASPLV
ncbi:putative nucleic acid-binding protein, contains PIN domain [Terriglobus roseus DSM 18391]|uniref:Putative nucleic acid-binding protein, contains PIN domain n=1 Tax=Terriglobus roseus (strain DSM 18391 / NRRL B-41598 / KBS 63) TaxID=926566 RepID=I3ZF48_TERRK|nr:putative nucleic acid-binding protein, contains PIN domain [Terriglobus roseus DSM 18391]